MQSSKSCKFLILRLNRAKIIYVVQQLALGKNLKLHNKAVHRTETSRKVLHNRVEFLCIIRDRLTRKEHCAMAHSCFARTAQRLDAEYDGGNSDSEGDDSDDEGDDTPMKLDTTATRCV